MRKNPAHPRRACRTCEREESADLPFATRRRSDKTGAIRTVSLNQCKDCERVELFVYNRTSRRKHKAFCPDCKTERTLTKAPAAYITPCRSCRGKFHQNGPKNAAYQGTKNIPLELFNHWRHGATANARDYDWAITIDDVQAVYDRQYGVCAMTGRQFARKKNNPDRMSLDRIDNTKGYVVGNIQLVTSQTNIAKHVRSVSELRRFASDIIAKAEGRTKRRLFDLRWYVLFP